MTKLTEIRKRLGMTSQALASACGISSRTLRNIACGSAPSRRARQAVTTALGVEIWSGIFPAERRFIFERGTETELPSIEEAKKMAIEFRGYVKRRGKVVTFIRPASFVIIYDSARGSARAPNKGRIFESVRGIPPATPTPTANL